MLINGRNIAQQILDNLKIRVQKLNHTPHLAVIRVGDDPAITSYIRQKEKMAAEIGAMVSVYKNPNEITDKAILEAIHFLQTNGGIDGIILQLPLPAHLDQKKLFAAIKPEMDVDGFQTQSPFMVPLAAAVIQILEYVYEQEKSNDTPTSAFLTWLKAKQIVVIGKGKAGGQSIIALLQKLHLNPQVIDSNTKNPWEITQQADVIISAVGKREVIMGNMLKKDVILIGIGMNKGAEGFYGDYDEEDIKDKASFYTPIPGGVGPVNVAKLMENLVIAAEIGRKM